MINVYTFILYLILLLFTNNIFSFELDISKIVDYSVGSISITVWKARELENLYTHKLTPPIVLKNICNGYKRLYFDQLVTTNQLLLSSSILWVRKKPLVIQLNLEKSSVILLNDNNSFLSVHAVFSEKTISNISYRIHSENEVSVDVDLSKIEDYDSNNTKVLVTKLEFYDNKFKRYTLRTYNLESNKLGRVLYKSFELKTVSKDESEEHVESILSFPDKDKVYSVRAYSYDDSPILIEVLYTFNRRLFYGHTPEKKWHPVSFQPFHDPRYTDHLYKVLNYYACKSGFKYTIDVSIFSDKSNHSYKIKNYCVGLTGVETFENNLSLPFYTDPHAEHRVYRCFEHTPFGDIRFFVDLLMYSSSLIMLPDTPDFTKYIRVYYRIDFRPYLIVFVDKDDKLHPYKYKDRAWKVDDTLPKDNPDRFNDSVIRLLDELFLDDNRLLIQSILILTDFKTNYTSAEIQSTTGVEFPSKISSENAITVSDQTRSIGSCLTSGNYKVFRHDLTQASRKVLPISLSLTLSLRLYLDGTSLSLYDDSNSPEQTTNLTYKGGTNDLYVYFYGDRDVRPLLMCYNSKAYGPISRDTYLTGWYLVDSVKQCGCSGDGNNNKLVEALTGLINLLNSVDLKRTTGEEYLLHNFKSQSIKITLESVTSSCFNKYAHKSKEGYRLGTLMLDKNCIKEKGAGDAGTCIIANSSEVVAYFHNDDVNHNTPLLVALKNGDRYQPYYLFASSTASENMYLKKDEEINLSEDSAYRTIDELLYSLGKTLQVILGKRQGDGDSDSYQAKIYENTGAQAGGGSTMAVAISDPKQISGSSENSGYKYYQHKLKSASGIKGIGALRLYLWDDAENVKEIRLHTDENGQAPVEKLYYNTCKGDIYVYFYGDRDVRPLLMCYNDKAFRPMNRVSYDAKWVQVSGINKCPSDASGSAKFVSELDKVVRFLNVIETHKQPGGGEDHVKCKLFKVHKHTPVYSKAGDIEVCKDENCTSKVTLNDGDYKNHKVLYEELFYNKYDTNHSHPIMLILHYEGEDKQEQKRYYKFSDFERDKSKPRDIFELPLYTNEQDFLLSLIDENDSVLNSVTYQLDKKDNSYNSKRVIVTSEPDFPCKGFIKYVHRPARGHTEGKSYILNNYDILLWWDFYNRRFGPINDFQDQTLVSVSVFYSPKFKEPLMVGFEKKNAKIKWEYYFQKRVNGLSWQVLDKGSTVVLLNLLHDKDVIQQRITENNNQKLIQVLKKIEYVLLRSISILIDKKVAYTKNEVLKSLTLTSPQVLLYPYNCDSQPENITVTEKQWTPLKKKGYKVFEHQILSPIQNIRDDERVDLKILSPSGTATGQHTEAHLYKPRCEISERTVTIDLLQQNVNAAYRGGKYSIQLSKKTYANSGHYVCFIHKGSANEKIFEDTFTLKYKDMGVQFKGNVEEAPENEQIYVYFHTRNMNKFIIALFPPAGGNKAKYLTYDQFINFYLSENAVPVSTLSELEVNLSELTTKVPSNLLTLLDHEHNGTEKVYSPDLDVLSYQKGQDKFYTYHKDNRPLMICYNGRAFRPKKLDSAGSAQLKVDYTKWYRVGSIKSCVCEETSSNEELIEAL